MVRILEPYMAFWDTECWSREEFAAVRRPSLVVAVVVLGTRMSAVARLAGKCLSAVYRRNRRGRWGRQEHLEADR